MRFILLALVCLMLLGITSCSAQKPAASAAPAALPAGPEGYQVIMWMLGGIPENESLMFQRLREANVTGITLFPGESTDPATRNNFNYYVENIHRIAFMFSTEHIYKEDRNAYVKTRDKQYLIRKPSLSDPAFFTEAKQDIQKKIAPFVSTRPLYYNLGDECSVTSFASPMDYDFAPVALTAFRVWLKSQYGTLEKLNAEWETKFATWEDVVPMTTYEIKDRERAGSENYAPWADHRTFMDISYAAAWRKFRDYVRAVDPKTPVGLEGTQHPSAFGGYDLWRLSQVVDWIEPYNIGESHAIFRSFLPEGTPILATVFEHDAKPASRRLWHNLMNGDRGNIIWCSSEWFDYNSPELTPKPWVAEMGRLFAELRGPAAQTIMNAHRDRAQIALLYSHPSIQVAWMLDSREDEDTWPNRHGSWDSVYGRSIRVRSSWCRLIEDLGLSYDFVSTDQLHDGTVSNRKYKVLILPAAYALSDQDAAAIKAFAVSGGTVIADYLPGAFDEHGKRRAKSALAGLFGFLRPANLNQQLTQPEASLDAQGQPLPAEPELGAPGEHPLFLMAQSVSKGHAHYLNISPIDYAKLRLDGKGDFFRTTLGKIFTQAGVKPTVRVTLGNDLPVGCEVISYHNDGKRYVAVIRNPEYNVSELGALGYGNNARFEQPAQITLHFDKPSAAKELLTGQAFKQAPSIELRLDPWKPVIVEVQ